MTFERCFVFVMLVLTSVNGEYDCVCSYNVEKVVYTLPDVSSESLGYIYEFDCKPIGEYANSTKGFVPIQFEKKVSSFKSSTNSQNK